MHKVNIEVFTSAGTPGVKLVFLQLNTTLIIILYNISKLKLIK